MRSRMFTLGKDMPIKTWNPFVGCKFLCTYCWAKRFAKRLKCDLCQLFVPHLHEERLKKMKRSALLINTARGAVIDTEALAKALREGWIAGAGLDVHESEPLDPNHPITAFKNVVLLPHIGSATYETRHRMAELVAENLIAFYKGEIPPTLVNKDVVKVRKPGFG